MMINLVGNIKGSKVGGIAEAQILSSIDMEGGGWTNFMAYLIDGACTPPPAEAPLAHSRGAPPTKPTRNLLVFQKCLGV